jgi:hypothetical protein
VPTLQAGDCGPPIRRRNLADSTPCTRSWRRYFLHPEVVTSMIDAARMIAGSRWLTSTAPAILVKPPPGGTASSVRLTDTVSVRGGQGGLLDRRDGRRY